MKQLLWADRGGTKLLLKQVKSSQIVLPAHKIDHLVVYCKGDETVLDFLPGDSFVGLKANRPRELRIAIVILDVLLLRLRSWLRLAS